MPNRNPLGIALNDTLPSAAPAQNGMSKGQIIMGIIADALAGAAGHQGPFAAHMAKLNEQEAENAKWGLRRRGELEDYEAKQKIEQRYKTPDISPMERDVAAWGRMSEPQRQAYQQMQGMRAGDADVFVTLPNGQVYAGPKSGLAQALTGGGTAPPQPVGRLRPINGGPTPPASGGFPR